MELYQLEYFRILCKRGSFTEASRELMVTQPAISTAVKKLEAEYGELIDRKSKTFALTAAGESVLRRAVAIHREVTEMGIELGSDLSVRREDVKIAFPIPLCPELMTGLATAFVHRHPEITIQILQKGHISIANELLGRTIDVGILCKDMLRPGLDFADYRAVEFYAFFSPKHRFSQAEVITPEMLSGETIVFSRSANSISGAIQSYFDTNGIRPNCVYRNILPEDARKMARRGTEIAFGPKYAGGGNSAPLSPPLYCELAVAWLKGGKTKQETELIDFITELGKNA